MYIHIQCNVRSESNEEYLELRKKYKQLVKDTYYLANIYKISDKTKERLNNEVK